ncbi:MAG: hypothetical protein NDI90_00750 [Nitrospira sp. BO4]|nr:hypothetical protein [Nitrospira sp. BO4]
MLRSVLCMVTREEPVLNDQRRRIQLIGLLAILLCAIGMVSAISIPAADTGDGPFLGNTSTNLPHRIDTPSSLTTAPQKAYDLLKQLEDRRGAPLPGYIGGRDFQNRERLLPRGRYREYDVNPKIPRRRRDAERIVIEQRTGKAYYTGDHYRTFVPLN